MPCRRSRVRVPSSASLNPPTYYKQVTSSSGNRNQVLKGVTTTNISGLTVIYSQTSGSPIPADQLCHNFDTADTTSDWSMTIQPNGAWTLNCNFAKA